MIGVLIAVAAGLLTYGFLYACNRLARRLEEHGVVPTDWHMNRCGRELPNAADPDDAEPTAMA